MQRLLSAVFDRDGPLDSLYELLLAAYENEQRFHGCDARPSWAVSDGDEAVQRLHERGSRGRRFPSVPSALAQRLHARDKGGMSLAGRRPRPRRKSEARDFAVTLQLLRREMKWSQDTLARKLGISRRSLVSWECGYWLPPHKQRMHVVFALRDVPPQFVLGAAVALGVSDDEAMAPLLAPFEAALEGDDDDENAAPPPPPPAPRPEPENLRTAVDAAVREAADAIDARANELRGAIGRVLAACAELGANLEETQQAVAPKGRTVRRA